MHARVAIVSGAAGGLGSAIAERLGAEGFAVAACDLAPTHGCALHAQLDVTDAEAVRAFTARVGAGVGPVDLVVTAAGIQRTGISEMVPEHDFRLVIDVNLIGTWNVIQAALPGMLERVAAGS